MSERRFTPAGEKDAIAFIGSSTSHALSSVGQLAELAPDFRLVGVDFGRAAAEAAASTSPYFEEDDSITDIGGIRGAVFTADMSNHLDEFQWLLDRNVPCLVHKPAARNPETLRDLKRVVGERADLILTGSILRFAPGLSGHTLASRVSATVDVRHPLGARLEAEETHDWLARIARDFGIHGIEILDALGRRPSGVLDVGWDREADVLTITLRGRFAVDQVTIRTAGDQESYRVEQDVVLIDLSSGPSDPLGHEAMHRKFLEMVAGSISPIDWDNSLTVLGLALTAAERAQETR